MEPAAAAETITDLYGFQMQATVQQQAMRQMCDGSSTRAEAAWMAYVQQQALPPDSKLKELIRKGVPPSLRPWVWAETSGAAKLKAAAPPSHYASMALAGEERSPWLKDIDQVRRMHTRAGDGDCNAVVFTARALAWGNADTRCRRCRVSVPSNRSQDITHTFPNHPWLHTPDGQAALRRVLAAYSMHNEAVGYCRCLNHIAALLLLALNR